MHAEQSEAPGGEPPEREASANASPTPIRPQKDAGGATAEPEDPAGYTVRQAAAELQVSMATIRRWMRDGTLASTSGAGAARIPEDAFARARRLVAAGRKGARSAGDGSLNEPLNGLGAEILALRREVIELRASLVAELHDSLAARAAAQGADRPSPWTTARTPSPDARWGNPAQRRTAVGIRADTLRASRARAAARLDGWERVRARVEQLRKAAEAELRRQVALARTRRAVPPAGVVAMRGYGAERTWSHTDGQPDTQPDADLSARAS